MRNNRFCAILTALALMTALVFAFGGQATAESWAMPAGLRIIDDEAFMNDASIRNVVIPEGVTFIGVRAFYGCAGLTEITLPASLTEIADDAFDECGDFTVNAVPGSYAYTWCMEHGYITRPAPTPVEELAYTVVDDLYVRITGYIGSDAVICIPEEIDGYPVQEIGEGAFQGNQELEYAFLPDSVSSIGNNTFKDCSALMGVDVGKGVEKISAGAFQNCTSLPGVMFPDTLTSTGDSLFAGCTSLSFFDYPLNWKSAGSGTVAKCPKLTELIVPEGAVAVPANAFANCTNLAKVHLSSTVASIGKNAFASCTSLEEVMFAEGLETVGPYAFTGCKNLTAALLPDSVHTIGTNAFENCASLETFRYPMSLKSVHSDTLNKQRIFYGCTKLERIVVPEGVTEIPADLFNGSNCLKYVELPTTLKRINNNAFKDCVAITGFDLPGGLEFVGSFAFAGCTSLTASALPDSVTALGTNAYEGCKNLESFHYPTSLNSVHSDTLNKHRIFYGCQKLERIVVPEGVTEIPANFFSGCNYLQHVELPSTLKRINNNSFKDCTAIVTLDLPDGLEFIGTAAFAGCTSLTAALLPDSVTAIGTNAYENCTSLAAFHYPLSLNNVHTDTFTRHRVFRACKMLERISIPAGVTAIPPRLFDEANCLKYLDVPDTVKQIGEKAFNACTAFEQLYLGYNVTSIGKNNFVNCPALTIWTEYGAVAHNYAVANGNAYYYLTPDGVNIPSGTLYRGDAYPLYGYARASVNLTNVTATIWDSTGATALQSISINPGVTDYSLSGEISSGLDFSALALGSYRFTLRASTDVSEELWADTAFRIVPPPLRVSRIGLNIPSGLYGSGDEVSVSGTISANYPISQIIVGVYDDNDAPTAQVYTGAPNCTVFELSDAGLSISELPAGSYVFKVIVTGNNETITAVCSDFTISGAPFIDIGKVDRDALSAFLMDSANSHPFANVNYYGSLEASLTDLERLKYAMYTSDQKIRSGMIDVILNGSGINESQRSEYLVTLYKEEITSFVKSQAGIYGNLIFKEIPRATTISDFVELHQLNWEQIETDLGSAASKYEKEYVESVNKLLEKVDWTITAAQDAYALAGYICDALLDYTKGIQILDSLAAQNLDPSMWNYNYQLAVQELKDEYTSNSLRLCHNLFKYAADKCAEEGHNQLVKCAVTALAGSKVYIVYKLTTAVWTFYTEETGFYDDVAKLDQYRAQVETFSAAYQNYKDYFNTLAEGKGDEATIAQMIQSFEVTRLAALRSMATLKTIPMHTRFVSDGELYRLTLEFQKMHCP